MPHLRRHAVAYVALLVALGGTSYAASYVITSPKQIAPKVRKALKGKRGPRGPAGLAGATGPAGAKGDTGTAGAAGAAGADAVIARTRLNWNTQVAPETSVTWHKVRTLGTVTKQRAVSVLQVMVNDGSAVTAFHLCNTQIRVDGQNDLGSTGTVANTDDSGTDAVLVAGTALTSLPWNITAVFTGLPAGDHAIELWSRVDAGGSCQENASGFRRAALVAEMN